MLVLACVMLSSCGTSDNIQGVYSGNLAFGPDTVPGVVILRPVDASTVDMEISSSYGTFSYHWVDASEEGLYTTLFHEGLGAISPAIIFVDGFCKEDSLVFDYSVWNGSDVVAGMFEGIL